MGPPVQAGITFAHNAYCYRCPFGLTYPDCEVRCAQDVGELIRTTTTGQIAGMIAEPIQGVGGFITPPKEYFKIVSKIVREYGGVFISDEVQTGWGRTGNRWWGIEQWGVTPDIVTSAKGLANGFPIGLTAARPEVADSVKKLTISTFGGGPIPTAAAKAVIDLIEEENLAGNAATVGAHLRASLEDLKEKYPLIGDVRGMGLMQAIELVQDRGSKAPATAETVRLAFIKDSSSATVFGNASAPPRTPPAPRATSRGVRPLASLAVRSAPLATRNSMNLSKPCSAAPCRAVWFGTAFALGI